MAQAMPPPPPPPPHHGMPPPMPQPHRNGPMGPPPNVGLGIMPMTPMQQGQLPPGQMHPGHMQQGHMHPGHMPQGQFPPGQQQSGAFQQNSGPNQAKNEKKPEWPKILRDQPYVGNGKPPIYEAYTLRRASPEVGQKPSWKSVQMSKMRLASNDIIALEKRSKNVTQEYDHLKTDSMRNAVDRVVEDRNIEEKDSNYQWELVVLDITKRPIISSRNIIGYPTAVETAQIRVIVKRDLKPGAVVTASKDYQKGKNDAKPQSGNPATAQQGNQQRPQMQQGQFPQQMPMPMPPPPPTNMGAPLHPHPHQPQPIPHPHPHHQPHHPPHHPAQVPPQPINITNNNNVPTQDKPKKMKKQKQFQKKQMELVGELYPFSAPSGSDDSDSDHGHKRRGRRKALPEPRMPAGIRRSPSMEAHTRHRHQEARRHRGHHGDDSYDEIYYSSDVSDRSIPSTPPSSLSDAREIRSHLHRRSSQKFSRPRSKSRSRAFRNEMLQRHLSEPVYSPRSSSLERNRVYDREIRSRRIYRDDFPPPIERAHSRSPPDPGNVVARAWAYEGPLHRSQLYDEDDYPLPLPMPRRMRPSRVPHVPSANDFGRRRIAEQEAARAAYIRGQNDALDELSSPQPPRYNWGNGRRHSEFEVLRERRRNGRWEDLDLGRPRGYTDEDFEWSRDEW